MFIILSIAVLARASTGDGEIFFETFFGATK